MDRYAQLVGREVEAEMLACQHQYLIRTEGRGPGQTHFSPKQPIESVFGQNLRAEKHPHTAGNHLSQSLRLADEALNWERLGQDVLTIAGEVNLQVMNRECFVGSGTNQH